MRTRWILGWALLSGLLLSACDNGGEESAPAEEGSVQADSTQTDSTQTEAVKAAVPVEVAQAIRGDISSYLLYNSTVETEESIQVFPQINGLVESIEVEEGDRVVRGDTLLRIEAEERRIALRESEVNLRHLETGFRRTEQMHKRNLISEQDYENKKYEIEQARLSFARARLALEHTVVRAPFSGVITERQVQVGSQVNSGNKLFDLIKLEDLIARVFVPGQHLTAIRPEQKAQIESEFFPGMDFSGWVKRISPVVDPKSGTFKVTIGIRDRWENLRPGVFVNVSIITGTHHNAVLVPKEAVLYEGGLRYVFLVQDSTAVRVKLLAGFENSSHIEVLEEVESGASVIVVGQNGLKDEARVRVIDSPDDGEAMAEKDSNDRG
ncbi:MAG: efflux RND transporter periplasmic adaptor subunit [Candidatus Latescibacteria bacterium]|nr:efflux RND transporter periplasmic adaptor subunit [Candidatus Latescibacterota bacterium]